MEARKRRRTFYEFKVVEREKLKRECDGDSTTISNVMGQYLVIQHLHLESEVFLQILNDHDQKGELDTQGTLRI